MNPLDGLLVLDFSQYLAGPSAALRLADLGARVIKVERPEVGEGCRHLAISNLWLDGDSTLFHTINRNKESFAADLTDKEEIERVRALVAQADVLIENFRPGKMKRFGLGYESVRAINPGLVYGSISGYGTEGPWAGKPGQDLLIQSLSGMAWLNGDGDQPPVPFGLAVVDMLTSANLVQGILALLKRREQTGKGGLIEVSLLESGLDFQFEVFTTHLNDGGKLPERSQVNNAHAYLGAPYGIYETKDGYLALAMGSVPELGELLECEELTEYEEPDSWFDRRDEIKRILVDHLVDRTTREWLDRLEPADYWCSDVLNWTQLREHEGFRALDMVQHVERSNGAGLETTRCPIRIDGSILTDPRGAPTVGEDNEQIRRELIDPRLAEGNVDPAGVDESGGTAEERSSNQPLEDVVVLDFSQFLAGPAAGLRLADLGARVIKVEHPERGDLCRNLYISDVRLDADSTLFHAINRNKESITADLKDPEQIEQLKDMIERVDVVIENFRPGKMQQFGLGYETLKGINPGLVYGSISGYGTEGPWADKPGQDLLAQSLSGLPWLNGDGDQPPVPFGLSIGDMLAGSHLVQGILACLRRRERTDEGGEVEVSLLESLLDFQFEVFTTHLNDGGKLPERSRVNNAHAYLGAPYGIYETKDGYLALAMGSVPELGELLECEELTEYEEPDSWFDRRDEIKRILVDHLVDRTTREWLDRLEPADYWCSDVLNWTQLREHEGFQVLDMVQEVTRSTGSRLRTTRCPIRVNGRLLTSEKGSPTIGEDNEQIRRDLGGST